MPSAFTLTTGRAASPRCCERWLAKQGYAGDDDDSTDDDDAQGALQLTSLNGLVALGERAAGECEEW